ncbi:glycyl-radical enzyme activating protein [Christensenellaceae bacterium OttesenSCG-928-M15]|nr:glycyl-radical enzyme activating protein [Christensenellaceae bacterium OttesenSCG-928-M15]
MSAQGEVFEYKRFAVHDGPGIRTTAFLKGCPLRCIWCHNPEGMRRGASLHYIKSLCIGCGACKNVCDQNAISIRQDQPAIDRTVCTNCGACKNVCPTGALEIKGCLVDASEVVEEFQKDALFYQTSGGGVTLSGGDPLFQWQFAREILRLSKEKGYHTAIETSLYAKNQVVRSLMDVIDLWICDLKLFDPSAHSRLTGANNAPILENYQHLAKSGAAMLTRIPMIPGCTDSEENLVALGRYIAQTNPKGKVELMFYNPLGASKYQGYGIEAAMPKQKPYTERQQRELIALLESTGVAII